MTVSIENEHISATFSTKGAELQHITGIHSDTEFLWSGDAAYWGKFSPVLFPIVGALKEDTYLYKGQTYHLPRHGFARDHEFKVTKLGEHELLFSLSHTEETLKMYPFEFNLGLRYKMNGATVSCTYEVSNPADTELLFSIGGHPAFAAPLNKEGTYTDYYLEFNNDEVLNYHHIVANLVADEVTTLNLTDRKLNLKHELFYNDALVFKQLKSNSISLMNTKNYNGLNFKFNDFPYFGIWAAKDAPFVCLEPWCGIADSVHHNQQLEEKEGIVVLAPKANWQRTWQVTCF